MDKTALSERDICTKFITPALRRASDRAVPQVRAVVSGGAELLIGGSINIVKRCWLQPAPQSP